MKIWCVARSLDNPANGGTGGGLIRISLAELGQWLQRSERSVWRYLRCAKSLGFFYRAECVNGQLTLEYAGLKRLAKKFGLKDLGAVGEFPLREINQAAAYATDIAAEHLQAQSFYKMQEEWGKYAKGAKRAADLLEEASSARMPGGVVLTKGSRLLYLSPHWRPFGGSQQTLSDRLGISVRTVQYRLSRGWRAERKISPIFKLQAAHEVFEDYPPEYHQVLIKKAGEGLKERLVRLGRKLFKVGCNLYESKVLLRSMRFRKWDYSESQTGILQDTTFEERVPGTTCVIQGGDSGVSLVPVTEDLKIFSPGKT